MKRSKLSLVTKRSRCPVPACLSSPFLTQPRTAWGVVSQTAATVVILTHLGVSSVCSFIVVFLSSCTMPKCELKAFSKFKQQSWLRLATTSRHSILQDGSYRSYPVRLASRQSERSSRDHCLYHLLKGVVLYGRWVPIFLSPILAQIVAGRIQCSKQSMTQSQGNRQRIEESVANGSETPLFLCCRFSFV